MTGQVISGRWLIDAVLGEGGMGAVFKAKRLDIPQVAAIKFIHSRFADNPNLRQRFLREVQLTAQLSHPNIGMLIDGGVTDAGELYLALEYVDGTPLSKLINKKGSLSPEDCLHLLFGICSAVNSAHKQGIIHRDLKPDNIMVVGSGSTSYVKVLDFGLAKIVEGSSEGEPNLSLEGAIVGTAHYMSPEQATADPLDYRTDIYSLGIVAYEMLSGKKPFNGRTRQRVLAQVVHEAPADLHEVNPSLPKKFCDIVMGCLEKDPAGRPSGAIEFYESLKTCLHECGGEEDAFGKLLGSAADAEKKGEWAYAVEYYARALKLEGFATNPDAIAGEIRCKGKLKAAEDFKRAISEAKTHEKNRNWKEAVKKYRNALLVPGYSESEEATKGLNRSKRRGEGTVQKESGRRKAPSQKTVLKEGKNARSPLVYALLILVVFAAPLLYYEYSPLREDRNAARLAYEAEIKKAIAAERNQDWTSAVAYYAQALQVEGYAVDSDAIDGRKRAEERVRSQNSYNRAMTMARAAEQRKDWDSAVNDYGVALKVEGYADDKGAKEGLKRAELNVEHRQRYGSIVARAREAERTGDWASAADYYGRALKVEGYAGDKDATEGLKRVEAKVGPRQMYDHAMEMAKEAERKTEWAMAVEYYNQALMLEGYARDRDAAGGLERSQRMAASVARQALAEEALKNAIEAEQRNELEDAANFYKAAFSVEGYSGTDIARAGLERVEGKLRAKNAYDSAITRAREAERRKNWASAVDLYVQALKVEGYEDDSDAKEGRKRAEGRLRSSDIYNHAIASARNAERRKNWASAVEHYGEALEVEGYEGDSDAKEGLIRAQNNLGYMYQHGNGVEQDYAEAVKWYRLSAEQGNAVAQYNLGFIYEHGEGVEQDYAEAVKWYRLSAEQGNASGQNQLGFMYYHGNGVEQDYAEAVKWYRLSAEQGHAVAQNNLGFMYQHGFGVEQDYAEAVKWFNEAALQGNEVAEKNLRRAVKMLEATQEPNKNAAIYTGFPFDTAQAKRRQEETAKALGLPVELSVDLPNGVKMELMLIPAGEFMMGSPEDEEGRDDDELLHRVRITKPFYMAKYECTQEQWQAITGENPSSFKDNPRNPVERVSWNNINDKFLPAIQRHAPRGMTFRLPTEAQWEYSARAGTSTRYHFGDNITAQQVNHGRNVGRTTPVGNFTANAWGLHDMHGNVWEWCRDLYDEGFYKQGATVDPENTKSGRFRVLRGGSWNFSASRCRSANRYYSSPAFAFNYYGFRLSLDFE